MSAVLVNQYSQIPEFNYAISITLPPKPLDLLVNATLAATTPGAVLRLPIDMVLGGPNQTTLPAAGCANWTALVSGESQAAQVGIGMSWLYMSCNWLVQSIGAVGPDNALFPPFLVDQEATACVAPASDWVGPDYHEPDSVWQEKLGITDADLDAVTRLLIVHGAWDRTASYGTPNLTPGGNRDKSRVIRVEGMAHGDSAIGVALYPRGLSQVVDLVGARLTVDVSSSPCKDES